jgi:hypothetical protein
MVKIAVRPKSNLRVEFAEGELQIIGEDGQPIDLTEKSRSRSVAAEDHCRNRSAMVLYSRIGFQGAERAVAEAEKKEPPK